MKLRPAILFLLIASLLSACSLQPSGTGTTPPQNIPAGATPTDTPPAVPPTDTPTPTPSDTPTVTPTETPSVPMITPVDQPVNCRFGPGAEYVSMGALKVGVTVPIIGQNAGGWWQIQNPSNPSTNCWVSGSVTTITGATGGVPFAEAPLTFVGGVSADQPDVISVPGCLGSAPALQLSGSIEVNGPITVTFHFETQQGGALGAQTVKYKSFGTYAVSNSSYVPPLVAGTYWVKLVVTSPNKMSGQSTYKISCP